MERKLIAEQSANWWTNLIKASYPSLRSSILENFKNVLLNEISNCSCTHSLCISTCRVSDKMLDKASYTSMLPVVIPRGYEMRIIMDSIYVYNSSGILIKNL